MDLEEFETSRREKAAWLREQIAFAIFNSTNPPHVRDSINLQNIGGNPELVSALGDGWQATSNLGLDWSLNRTSFEKLADVAINAMEAADADGPTMDAPDIDYSDVHLAEPWSGFSRLDIGPYKIGILITKEDGQQDPEAAGAALEEFIRLARSAIAKL